MKRSEMIKAIQEVLAEKKRPGLWANINAKKKRGEKASHGNSNAHKDAVAAGNAMKKEGEGKSKPAESPKEEDQRYIDYLRRSGRDDYADKLVALNPDKIKEEEHSALDLHYKKGYKDLTGLFKKITSSSNIETIQKLSHVFVDNLKKASKIQRAKYKATIQGGNKDSIFTLITNLYMNDSRMTSGLKETEHQGSNYKWPMSKATKDRKEADKKTNKK